MELPKYALIVRVWMTKNFSNQANRTFTHTYVLSCFRSWRLFWTFCHRTQRLTRSWLTLKKQCGTASVKSYQTWRWKAVYSIGHKLCGERSVEEAISNWSLSLTDKAEAGRSVQSFWAFAYHFLTSFFWHYRFKTLGFNQHTNRMMAPSSISVK